MSPGATQLTVICRLASSIASALVAPMIPALAARVIHLSAIARDARHRRQRDDAAGLPAADHGHDQRLHYVIKTSQVRAENLVPVFAGQRRERAVARDARVAYDAVVRPIRSDVGAERGGRRFAIRHIEVHSPRRRAGPGDFRDQGLVERRRWRASMHDQREAARARRSAIARPMPRLEPVTSTVSAMSGLREQRREIARPVRLERALGDQSLRRPTSRQRAFVGGEVRGRRAWRSSRAHASRVPNGM